jgi:prevent-host-death family protein
MAQTTVGVRELKAQLSRYLREVAAGTTVVITERGKPVGQIVPITLSTEERVQQLAASGVVSWDGRAYRPGKPAAGKRGGPQVSDVLLEDRE